MNKTDLKKMKKDTLIEELIKCENGINLLTEELAERSVCRSQKPSNLEANAYNEGYEAGIMKARTLVTPPGVAEDNYNHGKHVGMMEEKRSFKRKILNGLLILAAIVIIPTVIAFVWGLGVGMVSVVTHPQDGLCVAEGMEEPIECMFKPAF